MAEQRLQPSAPRHHVGVEECHEVGAARGQAGVARGRGPLAAAVPQHLNVAVHVVELALLYGHGRAVVDHHHAHSAQRAHQAQQARNVVAHWDNDGYVAV
jgi:hypothetical protein